MADVLSMTPDDLKAITKAKPTQSVGEDIQPTSAILISGGSATVIPGTSKDLYTRGFVPFPENHLSTQYAIALTNALAVFHAHTTSGRLEVETEDDPKREEEPVNDLADSMANMMNNNNDPWTAQIARPTLVASNLSIMTATLREANIPPVVVDRLDAIQRDVDTLTQFLHFASMMQRDSRQPSVGPICMSDIWISNPSPSLDEDIDIAIRLRGGKSLQAPPLRDCAWMWLTLLRPDVLRDRYEELNEAYCHAFNATIDRIKPLKEVSKLTSYDLTRDLGENLLHAFLTVAHKMTLGGVWPLDRQLHTSDGLDALGGSLEFLVEQGIIGSLFIA